MNWDDLKIFLYVGRASSLTAAGKLLNKDPATVGRRVQRLEETLSTQLFMRSQQGYELTEAGRKLLDFAAQMENTSLMAQEVAMGQSDLLNGSVRIGAPDGIANFILADVCADISEENPELELEILTAPSVVNLSKREADMAITVSAPTASKLLVRKITDYHLHLAATRDYISRHVDLHSLDRLQDHPTIGYISDLIFDKNLDYLNEFQLTPIPRLASNSVLVQMNMINQGSGIGVVHDFAMPSFPDLQFLLPERLSLQRSYYLVRHEDDRRMGRFTEIADRLVAGIRKTIADKEALSHLQ